MAILPLATAIAMAAILVMTACGSGATNDPSEAQTRQVLVDYAHDEVAASLFDYFPRKVALRPGDSVEFKQAWNGEPHSVTMGRLVDEQMAPLVKLFDKIRKEGIAPKDEPEEFKNFLLPYAFDDASGGLAQNAAQRCFIEIATAKDLPGDAKTPCPKEAQVQPDFKGQAFYNSGIIPFEGVGGNTYRVKLADDLAPGTYTYYCNVHGPLQYGQIDVKPRGTAIPSAADIAKEARRQGEKAMEPLLKEWRLGKQGKTVTGGDPEREVSFDAGKANLIGVPSPFFSDGEFHHGFTAEFLPKTMKGKVGEKVTWTFISGHTLSFNVPKYIPVFTVDKDGAFHLNDKVSQPSVWPGPPEPPPSDSPDGGPPPEPAHVDVTWDGKGFVSTGDGYNDGDTFSVTFTKPGKYPFACLLHPRMVGAIDISK
jgi:plastocyanin